VKSTWDSARGAMLAELTPWALRIALAIAASRRQGEYRADLAQVALYALSRAIDAHDPAQGEIKPFAAVWIRHEVHAAADAWAGQGEHGEPLPPSLDIEERAHDVLEALLDLYVGEELRSDGEALYLRAEALDALRREIARLDAKDRRLVELRYWEDLTWKQVAKSIGIGEGTAKERDGIVRERLRKALLAWDRVRPLRRPP